MTGNAGGRARADSNRRSPNSVDSGEGVHVVNPESLDGDKTLSARAGKII